MRTGEEHPVPEHLETPDHDLGAEDLETANGAFERLYRGAQDDLEQLMILLRASERRRIDLSADLEQMRRRRVVRFADGLAGAVRAMRARLGGRP